MNSLLSLAAQWLWAQTSPLTCVASSAGACTCRIGESAVA
jgi:hypothetical protein